MGDIMSGTIAAIATPAGMGGIGIVRISGPDAFEVADKLVTTARGTAVSEQLGYTCAYGRIRDQEGEVDEVIVTAFRQPHSYTGEDVVELAVHGGTYLLSRVLRACLGQGAVPAKAGEFTKRAFLNGKLDLPAAEAVADLISAQGKQAARAALTARDGVLSKKIDAIADRLTQLAAYFAAWIDYPEEELEMLEPAQLDKTLEECQSQMEQLLNTYDAGRVYREGIDTVIVGRPNAGKSTLMNLLAGRTRSIVSEKAGTTRDVITEQVRLGDVILNVADTAGIRNTADPIEQAGVSLAEEALKKAQLVVVVFDGSEVLDENDKRVMAQSEGRNVIALVNKNDLPQKLDLGELEGRFEHVVLISAKEEDCLETVREKIETLFALGEFDPYDGILANERQRDGLQRALGAVREAVEARKSGVSLDAVAVCVEEGIQALLELTGKKASQEVIDQVFSRFCVGK